MSLETWEKLCHPDDVANAYEEIRRHREGETQRYVCEQRLKRKDGTWAWILDVGEVTERDAQGKASRMVGVHINIDDQKRAQHEIQITEQRLKLALSAAEEGLWDWNMRTNDLFLNDHWFTMLGYEPGELPLRLETWDSRCHPDDLDRAYSELQRYLVGETTRYSCELRVRCKDGSEKWVLDVGEFVEWDADGNPTRMIGVHIDITEQKRVQNQLAEARAKAEAASEAKSGFLANMSHELRTPLTAILGFSEILGDVTDDAEGVANAAGIISSNAKHLLTLINDILDLSKIESDRVELVPIECSPSKFATDLDSMMRRVAEAKAIAFETKIEYPIAETVTLDEVRVRQILVNLVGNAIKFTSVGRVSVSLSCRPGEDGTTAFRVHVEDTGIGMDESCVEQIFQPFIQGEDSSTRQYGGTGLGLSISKRLAEMMGGRIEVGSVPDVGSRFTLVLPVVDASSSMINGKVGAPEEAEAAVPVTPGSTPLGRSRILLVEDGADNQKLLQLLLTKAGSEVVIASDGREGVDTALAASTPFDLVLMDMQMPVLDGYGATRELREAGVTIPILALTAYATAEDRTKCLEAGCDDFLTKPIARKDLIERCEAWISGDDGRGAKAA